MSDHDFSDANNPFFGAVNPLNSEPAGASVAAKPTRRLLDKTAEDMERSYNRATGNSMAGRIGANLELAGLNFENTIDGARLADYGALLEGYDPQRLEADPEYQQEYQTTRGNFEKTLQSIGDRATEIAAVPMRPETQRTLHPEGDTWYQQLGNSVDALTDDPLGVIGDITVQNAPGMVASVGAYVAGRGAGLGDKVAAGLAGATSGLQESYNNYIQLRQQGVDHSTAWEKSLVNGSVVGVFDALSFGTAGQTVRRMAGSPLLSKAVATGKETLMQGTLGAAGAAGGKFASNQDIEVGEVVAEFAGEMGGAPITMATTKVDPLSPNEMGSVDQLSEDMQPWADQFADATNPLPKRLPGKVGKPPEPFMTVDSEGNIDTEGRVSDTPAAEPVESSAAPEGPRYQWMQVDDEPVLIDTETGEQHGHASQLEKQRKADHLNTKVLDMMAQADQARQQREQARADASGQRTELPRFLQPDGLKPRPSESIPSAEEVSIAASETNTTPTDAQIKADNYKKGRVKIGGLNIAIENPQGSTRSGTDPDGNKWQSTMSHHYGDIKGHKGMDGDDIDVFIGPAPESNKVFVINQVDPKTKKPDEHKVMMGFSSQEEAEAGYLDNYEDGWQGLGNTVELDSATFNDWLKEGDTTKPIEPVAAVSEEKPTGNKATEPPRFGDVTASISALSDKATLIKGIPKEHRGLMGKDGLKASWRRKEQGWMVPTSRLAKVRPELEKLFAVQDEVETTDGNASTVNGNPLAENGRSNDPLMQDVDSNGKAGGKTPAGPVVYDSKKDGVTVPDLEGRGYTVELSASSKAGLENLVSKHGHKAGAQSALIISTGPGGSTNYVVMRRPDIFISASKKPFKSERAATSSLRSKLRSGKLPGEVTDYEVTPVDGGYGFRNKIKDTPPPVANEGNGKPAVKSAAFIKPESTSADVLPADDKSPAEPTLGDEYPIQRATEAYSHSMRNASGAARSHRDRYVKAVNELDAELAKIAETDVQKKAAAAAVSEFSKGYLAEDEKVLNARQGVVSWHIAGRSKFDSKQADRRDKALDRADSQFNAWRRAAVNAAKSKVLDARTSEQKAIDAESQAAEAKEQAFQKALDELMNSVIPMTEPGMNKSAFRGKALNALNGALALDKEETLKLLEKMDSTFQKELGTTLKKAVGARSQLWAVYQDAAGAGNAVPPASPESEQVVPTEPEKGLMANYIELDKKLITGESASLEEVRSTFDQLANNFDQLKVELNKGYTKPQLKRFINGHVFGDTKKPQMVKQAAESILTGFRFIGNESGVISSTAFGTEARIAEAREHVNALTDEKLAKHAEHRKAAREERETALKRQQEAVKDPQTLDDFDLVKRLGKLSELNDQQRARYDALLAEQQQVDKPAIKTGLQSDEQIELGDIEEGVHGKTGEAIFNREVVTRLGKEKFREAAAFARSLKGGYWKGNFYFQSREDADLFGDWAAGKSVDLSDKRASRKAERRENAALRLKDMAERLEQSGTTTVTADRKENTARRAAEAARVRENGEAQIHQARMINLIVDSPSTVLKGATQKVQLELLDGMVKRLQGNVPSAERNELIVTGNMGRSEFKAEVSQERRVKYARMPLQQISAKLLHDTARDMSETKGYKRAATAYMKLSSGRGNTTLELDVYHPNFEKLKDFIASHSGKYHGIRTSLQDYNRLTRMGVTSLPALRTALLEYMALSEQARRDTPAPSKLDQLQRDLKQTVLGNRKAFNDFFPTPDVTTTEVVELADIEPGMKVLEPSGGNGMLADAMREAGANVDVVELAGPLREILDAKGHRLVGADFLEYQTGTRYDRIVMNPPFSKDQDIQHVHHAYSMLAPGGRLVAITSSMAGDRQNKRNQTFREWLTGLDAQELALPENAFKSSLNPTAVRTKVLVVDKPEQSTVKQPEASAAESLPKPPADIAFSEATGAGQGLTAEAVKKAVARQVLTWENGPGIDVVQSISDLPQHIQKAMTEAGISAINGARDPWAGRVYLVADHLKSPTQARKILAHEAVGHYAMEQRLGDEFGQVLEKVQWLKRTSPRIQKLAQQVRQSDPAIESAEIIARLSEENANSGIAKELVTKAYAALRKFLKKLGFQVQFGIPELKAMLVDAARYLRTGGRAVESVAEPATAFSESDPVAGTPLFSESGQPSSDPAATSRVVEELEHYGQQARESLAKAWKKNWTADLRPAWLGLLTRRHIADLAGRALPQIKQYMGLAQEMDARRNELLQEGAKLAERWTKYNLKNRKESQQLADLMHQATIAGVDPSKPHEVLITAAEVQEIKTTNRRKIKERSQDGAGGGKSGIKSQTQLRDEIHDAEMLLAQERGRVKARPQLEKQWEALSPEGKTLFKEVRDAYKDRQKQTLAALEQRVGRAVTDGKQAAALMAKLRGDFESAAVQEPYFPLKRFGKYWVSAKQGDEQVFEMFEGTSEQSAFMDEMRTKGYQVRHGASLDDLKQLDGVSAKFVTGVENMLDTELGSWPMGERLKDEIYQMYLQTLPDLSMRKHFIHRKKTTGFAKDATRAYADTMFHGSYQLARLEYADLLGEQLTDMREGLEADLNKVEADIETHQQAQNLQGLSEGSLRSMHGDLSEKLESSDPEEGTAQKLAEVKLALKYQKGPKKQEAEYVKLLKTRDAAKRIGGDRVKAAHLYNEMLKRHEWAMNPKGSGWANKLGSLGFVWYLGVSPAAALVNVTQTPMVAYPMLAARFGWEASGKALLDASETYFKGGFGIESELSGDRLRAYEEAVRTGLIDKTLAHDLASVSQEGATYNPVSHWAMSKVAFLFHNAERLNREVTYLAAYDLARKSGQPHQAAVTASHDLVWESHFDYSSGNKARFMQNDFAKVALMFRQFSLNMTYMLARNAYNAVKGAPGDKVLARRQLTGILGAHFVFAGAMGMPLFSVLASMMDMMFDDEDEPFEFKTEFRNFLADTVGQTAGETLSHGVGNAMGVELAARVGLDNLWLREPNRELEGRDTVKYWMEQLLGPIGGIALSMGTAADLWQEGHYAKALESTVPKFARDGLRAIRYAQDGAQTLRGDPLVDEFSLPQLAFQLLGLSPSELSERYDANNAVKGTERRLKDRRKFLINRFALAARMDDAEGMKDANEAITRFNRSNWKIRITRGNIMRSLRGRRRFSRRQQHGVLLDKKLRHLYDQGRFAQ